MKYLDRFLNYLNESQDFPDLTTRELDDMLSHIRDMDIEYTFSKPGIVTDGAFAGQNYMNITFKNDFRKDSVGGYRNQIVDQRFWEFLEELVIFKSRLESPQVSITTNWENYIVLTFVQNSKITGDFLKLSKLYNEMCARMDSAKSDFANSMTRRINKDTMEIEIKCGGGWDEAQYTDRKWNLMFRGIDFSDFNVNKKIENYIYTFAYITITLKNPEEH